MSWVEKNQKINQRGGRQLGTQKCAKKIRYFLFGVICNIQITFTERKHGHTNFRFFVSLCVLNDNRYHENTGIFIKYVKRK